MRAGLKMSAPSIPVLVRRKGSFEVNFFTSSYWLLVPPVRCSKSVATSCWLILRWESVFGKPIVVSMNRRWRARLLLLCWQRWSMGQTSWLSCVSGWRHPMYLCSSYGGVQGGQGAVRKSNNGKAWIFHKVESCKSRVQLATWKAGRFTERLCPYGGVGGVY